MRRRRARITEEEGAPVVEAPARQCSTEFAQFPADRIETTARPDRRPHQTSRLLLRIDYGQARFERRGLQLSIRGDKCELPGVGLKLLFQHQG